MSTAKESSSTGWVTRNRRPAAIPRKPAVGLAVTPSSCTGGIGGSRQVAHNVMLNSTASIAYAMVTPVSVDQSPKISPAASGPRTPPAVVVV
jgi:hypothetical protein